jgi:AcrR family transcriptional regulator
MPASVDLTEVSVNYGPASRVGQGRHDVGMDEGRTYRGRTATERTSTRRAALLEAALDLLGDGGATVTMTAVCDRAGLTERYFYESFRNREELLLTLLDQVAEEVRVAVDEAVGDAEGDQADVSRRGLDALLGVLGDDPRKGRFALISSAQVPVLRERRAALLDGFAALLIERTRQMYGVRAWAPPDDRIEALLFVGGLAELLAAWLAGELDATRDQVMAAATRHFLATAHR